MVIDRLNQASRQYHVTADQGSLHEVVVRETDRIDLMTSSLIADLFPDIDGGWVKEGGTMGEVDAKLTEMYGGGRREWFGHPARMGASPASSSPPSSPSAPSPSSPTQVTVEGASPTDPPAAPATNPPG